MEGNLMAYRNGTYVAFNGCGTTDPTEGDLKYYALLKAWNKSNKFDFSFSDSHEKTYSVLDTSRKETLKNRLLERLRHSKQFLLIITENSSWNRGLLNWEIEKAVDNYGLPIIVAYTMCEIVRSTSPYKKYWPSKLKEKIDADNVKTIHIPFKQKIIIEALEQFDINNKPKYTVTIYKDSVYKKHGII